MIKLSKTLLMISIVTICFACHEKQAKKERYVITGNVSGFPNGTKLYLRNLATDAIFDSTIVDDNHFKFEGELDNPPEQIWLNGTVDNKFVYANLLIGNDDIIVSGDISDFPWRVSVTGSKVQEDFNYSREITKKFDVKRDSLTKVFIKLTQEEQQQQGAIIWDQINKIDAVTKDLRIEYVKANPDTYISVIDLGYLKNELPKDTIKTIYEKYTPEIKASKYARLVEVYLRENILNIGDRYQDFEGLNQKGEKARFSEVKGDYTLIDFTSAYCGPCMLAADELSEMNRIYSDSLTIVSFSGDSKKDSWLKSVERDKVSWTSIWDGKGRFSETAIKYGIQGFPTFVLIDHQGVIIDKWIGFNKGNLKSRLEKHLYNK
jgi:peroxiredoxin